MDHQPNSWKDLLKREFGAVESSTRVEEDNRRLLLCLAHQLEPLDLSLRGGIQERIMEAILDLPKPTEKDLHRLSEYYKASISKDLSAAFESVRRLKAQGKKHGCPPELFSTVFYRASLQLEMLVTELDLAAARIHCALGDCHD